MTYNEQETTWNDLKRRTTSKTQLTITWTYLQRAKTKKRRETTNKKQILSLFYNRGNRFSSLTRFPRFPTNIWLQSFEHCFTENLGENRASNISTLSCVYFTGYKIYFFLSGFRVKNIHKSQGSRERERLFFSSSLPFLPASQIVRSSAFEFIGEV